MQLVKMDPMREIKIEKVTLNIGAGKDQTKLDKALILLERIGKAKPVKTVTSKRIPEWGLRPGLPIGCKLTLRNSHAVETLKNLLKANDSTLKPASFDSEGNISFGIHEYIDIPGIKYDPQIGIMGLQVCVTLKRAGFRIKYRKLNKKKIPARHRIPKQEAMNYMKTKFDVKIEEEE